MRFTRGTEYKGTISQTADGQTCSKWDESLLMMIDSTLTSVSGSEPYCRNFEPFTGPSPWCFTNYFYISMCEVPFCGKSVIRCHGLLARYVKLWVAHAPGIKGTFSLAPRVSDSGMHHGTCVTHVPWCMSGSITLQLIWWSGTPSFKFQGFYDRVQRSDPMPPFTIQTLPYGYRNTRYKLKTAWRWSQFYNVNPYTNTMSSKCI